MLAPTEGNDGNTFPLSWLPPGHNVLPEASIVTIRSIRQACGPPVTLAGISVVITSRGSVIFIISSHSPVIGLKVYPGGHCGLSVKIVLVVKK